MEEEYKDKALYYWCGREADKVDFLTRSERKLYVAALYNAEMWARAHPCPVLEKPLSEMLQEKS